MRWVSGWDIGIRTPTYRVRVCCATVTQYPNVVCSLEQDILYHGASHLSIGFLKKFKFIFGKLSFPKIVHICGVEDLDMGLLCLVQNSVIGIAR